MPDRALQSYLEPSKAIMRSPEPFRATFPTSDTWGDTWGFEVSEVSWMLKRLKCRGWYTSDTSDTWVFEVSEVSEVSEVCLTEPFRAIQSPPEPSRASFLEQDTSDTSDTWVFEVSEVSEVSEVCPTAPSRAIQSPPKPS